MSAEWDTDVRARLTLIVPLGVDPHIFPWGVHTLADYVRSAGLPVDVDIWQLSRDPYFADLHRRHGELLGALFDLLRSEPRQMFLGHALDPQLFLGLLACLGPEFFAIGLRHRIFVSAQWVRRVERARSDELRTLQREVAQHLDTEIDRRMVTDGGAARIWGVSVYDYTLFNSLYLTSRIRRRDPGSTIVLGGDYFAAETARTLVAARDDIDGVVVGYGEEPLRQVVQTVLRGELVRRARIEGLVSHREPEGEPAAGASGIMVPLFLRQNAKEPPVRFVRRQRDGSIHILTQRGCSWGNCTFCSQIDRKLFFPIHPQHILDALDAELPAPASSAISDDDAAPRRLQRIFLDADENDLGIVLPLLAHLEAAGSAETRFLVELWLMVRKFRPTLPRALRGSSRVFTRVLLNIESLSRDTLKHMRKGHSPLEALQAIKAMQDCGQLVSSNYFIHYPGETPESIAQEATLLTRAVHLLMPPYVSMAGFSYAANGRDAIHDDQNRHGVRVRRIAGDVWIDERFGVDLPFTIWAHTYSVRWKPTLRDTVAYTFHRATMAQKRGLVAHLAPLVLERRRPTSVRDKAVIQARECEHRAWRALHLGSRALARDEAHARREGLFRYIEDVMRTQARAAAADAASSAPATTMTAGGQTPWRRPWQRFTARLAPERQAEPSRLFLAEGVLVKDYRLPGCEDAWSLRLDEQEIGLLRHLYWRRKLRQIHSHFAGQMDEATLHTLLERHRRLGSVVELDGWWLAVVNDPEYWDSAEPPAEIDQSAQPGVAVRVS